MKQQFTRLQKIIHNTVFPVAAILVVLALVFSQPAAVFAQDGTPPTQATPSAKSIGAGILELQYKYVTGLLNFQEENLQRASDAATKANDLIDKAKSNGKDVSALETALKTFTGQITTAQSAHDAAALVLNTHAGFDENGKVTDAQTARQTLKDARDDMRQTRELLKQAVQDLREAVRTWRQQNHPTPTPTAGANS
jgi:hypothetical protein